MQNFRPAVCLSALFLFYVSHASSKVLDLRNATDSDGSVREVSICARPTPDKDSLKTGLPGHAFIAFSVFSKDGKRYFRAIGHTVNAVGDALVSYNGLIPASGVLANEHYTAIKQECLTLQVNKVDYELAYKAALQPLASIGVKFDESQYIQKSYSLGVEDCIKFAQVTANGFVPKGLKVPKRDATDLPLPYVRKLISAN